MSDKKDSTEARKVGRKIGNGLMNGHKGLIESANGSAFLVMNTKEGRFVPKLSFKGPESSARKHLDKVKKRKEVPYCPHEDYDHLVVVPNPKYFPPKAET